MTDHQQTIDRTTDYFSTINMIAKKIYFDIDATKIAYEQVWNDLNVNEQNDLINEALIRSDIELCYIDNNITSTTISTTSTASSNISAAHDDDTKPIIYSYDDRKDLDTFIAQKTAQKLIQDDSIGVFRDEHSAPFSYRTRSQINLNLFKNTREKSMENCSKTTAAKVAMLKNLAKSKRILVDSNSSSGSSSENRSQQSGETSSILPVSLTKNPTGKYERLYSDEKRSLVEQKQDSNRVSAKNSIDEQNFNVNIVDTNYEEPINFITKFLCKNNLIFNNPSADMMIAAEGLGIEEDNSTIVDDSKILIDAAGSSIGEKSSLQSEDDDDKLAYEESRLLLDTSADDLRKNFDFLNNW